MVNNKNAITKVDNRNGTITQKNINNFNYPQKKENFITTFSNDFIKSVLESVDLSNIVIENDCKFTRIGKNMDYTIEEKLSLNSIKKYEKDIYETLVMISYKINDILKCYNDKKILFYNIFTSLYKNAQREGIKNSDDIIDYVINSITGKIQIDKINDDSQLKSIALYFTLHAFIECKILERPIKNVD